MTKDIDIWVEGVADQKFIADILTQWYGVKFDGLPEDKKAFEGKSETYKVKIRGVGGVTPFIVLNSWKEIVKDFEDNSDQNIKNLVILDADADFQKRKSEVLTTTNGMVTEKTLFLMPLNDKKGNLETLLESIVPIDKRDILTCFQTYIDCLNGLEKNYTTPQQKAKIFAFLEANGVNNKGIQERNRDYSNQEHWNLNPEHEALIPLKAFFDQHLFEE